MTDEHNTPWGTPGDPADHGIDPAAPHTAPTSPSAGVQGTAPLPPATSGAQGDPHDTSAFDGASDAADPSPVTAGPTTSNADDEPTSVIRDAGDLSPLESHDGPYRPAPQYGAFRPDSAPAHTPAAHQPAANPTAQPTQQMPPFGLPYQDQNQHQQHGQPQSQPTQPFGGLFGQPAGQQPGNAAPTGQQHGGTTPNGPMPPQGRNPFGGPNNPYSTPMKQAERTPNNVLVAVVAAVVTAAICLGLGYAALANGWVNIPGSGSMTSLTNNKGGEGTAKVEGGETPDWTAVSNKVSKSVVSIQTQLQNGVSQGTGAILDKDGDIVTNNHVVSGAQRIVVTLDNGDLYEAKIVGTDTTTDLAVIKLENPPADLTAVEFADSDNLAPGEPVMAIGNPLGYDGTVTTGIVSALDRPVTVMDEDNTAIVTNAVQIDAAINPGNSGGPTFNAAGQVIGINSSIASMASGSESAGSIGIGFAIPSNLVKRVANEIIKNGKVQHVALGVTIQSGTVTADGVTRGGAVVKSVVDGGPAQEAGVKVGDTIVGFNGLAVSDNYSLLGFVRAAAMDSTAKLTVVRDGKTLELDVKFDKAEDAVNGTNRQESNNQNQQRNQDGNGNDGSDDSDGLINPFEGLLR
ncbi:DO serine protease [Bifidobacterium pseudolongum subsp. globosum]|uniref:DO serine protease n=1 Tax=Bifidobacterium pseudolongum subsp. globosum TaxID=1690 RepID=A0A2N3QLQ4_9BIFI|nr:trypsin-like peptidase domain-containing protein [Bifidobacterium pseudolongum]PKU92572.1 DO serine protease [Bifidobacterium pseudolongum subsp. globosum]